MDYYSDEEDIENYGEADMSNEDMWKCHQGYDVDMFPVTASSLLFPLKLEYYDEVPSYAKLAIDYFNEHNHTDFKILEVVKANAQLVSGILYYITFKAQAANNGKIETFQGKIWRHIPKENGVPDDEVLECRIKPTTSSVELS